MTPQDQNELEEKIEELASPKPFEAKIAHPNLDDLNTIIKSEFPLFVLKLPLDELRKNRYPVGQEPKDDRVRYPVDEDGVLETDVVNSVGRASIEIQTREDSRNIITESDIAFINRAIEAQVPAIQKLILDMKSEADKTSAERMCRRRIRLNGEQVETYEL